MKHISSLFNKKYNTKEGVVKINVHNTLEHETAKLKLMFLTKQMKESGWSEVIFLKGRADHVMTPGRIIEVLHSENKEMILRKKDYYPAELMIEAYTTEEILDKDFNL